MESVDVLHAAEGFALENALQRGSWIHDRQRNYHQRSEIEVSIYVDLRKMLGRFLRVILVVMASRWSESGSRVLLTICSGGTTLLRPTVLMLSKQCRLYSPTNLGQALSITMNPQYATRAPQSLSW